MAVQVRRVWINFSRPLKTPRWDKPKLPPQRTDRPGAIDGICRGKFRRGQFPTLATCLVATEQGLVANGSYCCSLCEKTARVHSADATVQPPPLGRGPVRGTGRVAERERGPGDQLATSTRSYQ